MPTNKKKPERKNEQLTKRSIQLFGFGSAGVLFAIKLVIFLMGIEGDIIPWWVIMGLVGMGVSGSYDINLPGGKK